MRNLLVCKFLLVAFSLLSVFEKVHADSGDEEKVSIITCQNDQEKRILEILGSPKSKELILQTRYKNSPSKIIDSLSEPYFDSIIVWQLKSVEASHRYENGEIFGPNLNEQNINTLKFSVYQNGIKEDFLTPSCDGNRYCTTSTNDPTEIVYSNSRGRNMIYGQNKNSWIPFAQNCTFSLFNFRILQDALKKQNDISVPPKKGPSI